jgi:nucleoside-diphosphate-sugar epimerase
MRIKDARQTFVGIWIRNLLEGKPLEVWGGEQIRDFTDVEDAADAFLVAASSDDAVGEIFNLGGPATSIRAAAELLVSMQSSARIELKEFPSERLMIDIGDYRADHGKVRNRLGWQPVVPLNRTFERMLGYYRANLTSYVAAHRRLESRGAVVTPPQAVPR